MGYFVEFLQVNIQKETSVEGENILEKYNLFHIFEALRKTRYLKQQQNMTENDKIGGCESKCYVNLLIFSIF